MVLNWVSLNTTTSLVHFEYSEDLLRSHWRKPPGNEAQEFPIIFYIVEEVIKIGQNTEHVASNLVIHTIIFFKKKIHYWRSSLCQLD